MDERSRFLAAGGAVHYYRKTALWGAAFFSDMRQVVEDVISPALGAA